MTTTAKAAAFTISASGYTLPLGARYAGVGGGAPAPWVLIETPSTAGAPFGAGRDWAPLAHPKDGHPGLEIRYTDIWGTGEFACARVELRQMTP
jgi:hypothetical protein